VIRVADLRIISKTVATLPLRAVISRQFPQKCPRKQRITTRVVEGVTSLPFPSEVLVLIDIINFPFGVHVATLPQKRGISYERPLHLLPIRVASLRKNVNFAFQFNGLQLAPVFSPVVPIDPSLQRTNRRTNWPAKFKAHRVSRTCRPRSLGNEDRPAQIATAVRSG
jgi:hypothetical protein